MRGKYSSPLLLQVHHLCNVYYHNSLTISSVSAKNMFAYSLASCDWEKGERGQGRKDIRKTVLHKSSCTSYIKGTGSRNRKKTICRKGTYPEIEFLITNLQKTRVFFSMLFKVPSIGGFYKKTTLYSAFKNTYKK
jgi:hypothetical protein